MRRTGSYLPRVRTSPVALAVLLAPALPIPTLFVPVSRPIPVASGRSSDEEHVQNRGYATIPTTNATRKAVTRSNAIPSFRRPTDLRASTPELIPPLAKTNLVAGSGSPSTESTCSPSFKLCAMGRYGETGVLCEKGKERKEQ